MAGTVQGGSGAVKNNLDTGKRGKVLAIAMNDETPPQSRFDPWDHQSYGS